MAQIFHRSANSLSRLSILAVVVVVTVLLWAALETQRAPYVTYQNVAQSQPVPFSHQHHNAGLGIDCRYCHTSVEQSSYAGIPPTKTCMNCHSQIGPMLRCWSRCGRAIARAIHCGGPRSTICRITFISTTAST